MLEISQLEQRADRALPNGLCTLPPAKTCDRGNACLTCGHFATDATHLPEHRDQRRRTLEIVEVRQGAFASRHGQPMPDTNIWMRERQRELDSLEAIIGHLEHTGQPVISAGTTSCHPKEQP